jgi:branched-chain amino acid transport system ATP-binding protein
MAVLEIKNLETRRGAKTVLHDISMRLETGKTVALLGPNGAGKSSLVLALAGVLPITAGEVTLDGRRLNGMPPHLVRATGLAAVPEGHQVLTGLTVLENLSVAAALHPPSELEASLERAFEVFNELRDIANRTAGNLSGGQQQMLAFAQALIARPAFLLADEMSLGLAPVVVRRLMSVVREIAAEGIGILLIEQFTHVALDLADFVYVINRGRIRYAGDPSGLRADRSLLHQTYLAAG